MLDGDKEPTEYGRQVDALHQRHLLVAHLLGAVGERRHGEGRGGVRGRAHGVSWPCASMMPAVMRMLMMAKGIKPFQPRFISWSKRKRGSVQRTHMKRKMKKKVLANMTPTPMRVMRLGCQPLSARKGTW